MVQGGGRIFPAVFQAFALEVTVFVRHFIAFKTVHHVENIGEAGLFQTFDGCGAALTQSAHDQNRLVRFEPGLNLSLEIRIADQSESLLLCIPLTRPRLGRNINRHRSVTYKVIFLRGLHIEYLHFLLVGFPHLIGFRSGDVFTQTGVFLRVRWRIATKCDGDKKKENSEA